MLATGVVHQGRDTAVGRESIARLGVDLHDRRPDIGHQFPVEPNATA